MDNLLSEYDVKIISKLLKSRLEIPYIKFDPIEPYVKLNEKIKILLGIKKKPFLKRISIQFVEAEDKLDFLLKIINFKRDILLPEEIAITHSAEEINLFLYVDDVENIIEKIKKNKCYKSIESGNACLKDYDLSDNYITFNEVEKHQNNGYCITTAHLVYKFNFMIPEEFRYFASEMLSLNELDCSKSKVLIENFINDQPVLK
jgi:hypothetical protein